MKIPKPTLSAAITAKAALIRWINSKGSSDIQELLDDLDLAILVISADCPQWKQWQPRDQGGN